MVKGSLSEDGVDGAEQAVEEGAGDADRAPSRGFKTPPKRGRRHLPVLAVGVAVVAAVALAAVLVTPGSSKPKAAPIPTTTVKPGFTEFADHNAGFSLSYPASWAVTNSSDANVPLLVAFGEAGLNTMLVRVVPIQVSQVDTKSAADIKAFTDAVISGTNVIVLKQQAITVAGLPGYYYLYTLPKDPATGVVLVHSHFFVFPPHEMVSLVFQTVEQDFQGLATTFDQVVASFHAIPTS